MTGLDMLDVAIGMIFIYLLLSLICSAVTEIIEAFMKQRAYTLENGLRSLLIQDSEAVEKARKAFEDTKTAKIDAAKTANIGEDVENRLKAAYQKVISAEKESEVAEVEKVAAEKKKAAAQAELTSLKTNTADNKTIEAAEAKLRDATLFFERANQTSVDATTNLDKANTDYKNEKEFEKADTDNENEEEKEKHIANQQDYLTKVIAFFKAETRLNEVDKVRQLYYHPLIFGLFPGDYDEARNGNYWLWGKLPSYIPSENFALALMDLFAPAATTADAAPRSLSGVRDSITKIENDKVKQALLPLVDAARGNIDAARANIEKWYDNAMDRIAGTYKRRVQYFTFALGLIAAIFLNADSITILKSLFNDPKLRDAVVANAQEYARVNADLTRPTATPTPVATPSPEDKQENPKIDCNGNDKDSAQCKKIAECNDDKNKDSSQCKALIEACADPSTDQCKKSIMACTIINSSQCKSEECRKDVNSSDCKLAASLDQVRQLGLPLGWNTDDPRTASPPALKWFTGFSDFLSWIWIWIMFIFFKLPGWLITAVAVSLGAPFWFDLLNKFMVIRSTVKPTEKSPNEESKD